MDIGALKQLGQSDAEDADLVGLHVLHPVLDALVPDWLPTAEHQINQLD